MRIDFLRELVVLAQCGNFRVAADKLYISQPTLSNHIKAIEQELGFELFDRASNNELTEVGSVFLDGVRSALASVDSAIEECQQIINLRESDAVVRIAPCGSLSKVYALLENHCTLPYAYVEYDMRKPIFQQFSKGNTDILVSSYDLDLLSTLHDEAKDLGLNYALFGIETCSIAMKSTNPLATGELTRERLRGAKVAILSMQNRKKKKNTILNLLGFDLGRNFCFYPVDTPENFRTIDLEDRIYLSISKIIS